jgi:predicted PurR-regulated permease PerM
MTTQDVGKRNIQVNQALETSIQIGMAALLVIGCLLILRPFIPLIMWGIIIAIACYPAFLKLQHLLKGRGALAAVLWTLLLMAVLIVPVVLLGQQLVEGLRPLVAHLREGTLVLPPPPATVANWAIIGVPLSRAWSVRPLPT